MNHANLTARYRPQTFSDLAGQDTVRAILSRAAAENKVAPAYLFSGTRGVGKTTVARIFAKALNCVHAPAAEPCNTCERCRQITIGTAVDVVEIDGASNRGIDDVRKLKEVVGYAPMEGRYRVFIIDEAHMLSRDAFNALLKTLEEPPANVTFVLATTEPHKFPATIISRCQHYVFKRLPEHGLEEHLTKILTREGAAFDEAAVRLIARRAAGSVRDAMSLLGQVLALGSESLTESDARTVLGLAGQELFFTLFRTLREGDGAALTSLVSEMLDSGLDLGFFLREMTLCWRNMFIIRQSGERALPILDIPARDAARWQEEAASFDLAHIHAAWQMTIDAQRRVLTSLEPALALELLLLNIAMLPRLLPLEGLARMGRAAGSGETGGKPGPAAPSTAQTPSGPVSGPPASGSEEAGTSAPSSDPGIPGQMESAAPPNDSSWSAFLRFCKQQQELSSAFTGLLRTLDGEWRNGALELTPGSEFCADRLRSPETSALFTALAREHYGEAANIRILPPPAVKTVSEVKEELRDHPAVRLLEKEMGARLIDYGITKPTGRAASRPETRTGSCKDEAAPGAGPLQ